MKTRKITRKCECQWCKTVAKIEVYDFTAKKYVPYCENCQEEIPE